MTPPDPRGVAGLVEDVRRMVQQDRADAAECLRLAVRLGLKNPTHNELCRDQAQYEQSAQRLEQLADRLQALAASPVSQPTVGGGKLWPLAVQVYAVADGLRRDCDRLEAAERLEKLGDHINSAPHIYAPASVEPVSQDAEDAARLDWLAGESRKLVGPRKYRAVLTFRMADHHETMAQALREALDMGRAAARQEKGR